MRRLLVPLLAALVVALAGCAVSGLTPVPGVELSGSLSAGPLGFHADGSADVDSKAFGCGLIDLLGISGFLGLCEDEDPADAPAEVAEGAPGATDGPFDSSSPSPAVDAGVVSAP